jgi:hypothetical protein
MNVQLTSIESFQKNIQPQLGSLKAQVKRLLEAYPDLTNKEIARFLGKDASTVSGIVGPMVNPKDPAEAPTLEKVLRTTLPGNRKQRHRLEAQIQTNSLLDEAH